MASTRDYDIDDRSDKELVIYASHWENAMYGEDDLMGRPAAEYDWTTVDFPISDIESAPEDWVAWMKEEIAMWVDEGQPDRFDDMFDQPIRDKVVLVVDAGRGFLWDGYHRTGASVMKGETTVRAVIGTLRPEHTLASPKGP